MLGVPGLERQISGWGRSRSSPYLHYPGVEIRVDEVGVVWKPADGEDRNDNTEHLDYLRKLHFWGAIEKSHLHEI